MATMKTVDGQKYPASAFLYAPGDTVSEWKLRYRDASGKVDPALLGPAHAALTVGWRGQKVDLPDAEKRRCLSRLKALYKQAGMDWPEDAGKANMSATEQGAGFALSAPVRREDGYVIRRGKLFEGGDFSEEPARIWLTPDDLVAAVAAFSVGDAPVDLSHVETVLDGKLGEVRSLAVGEDGWSLFGEVALPEWLDAALEASGRKVSAMWDRATKRLTGLALVTNPRITDAALMAAFAGQRHSATDAKDIQAIHDLASKQGADCAPPTAGMSRGTQSAPSPGGGAERVGPTGAGRRVPMSVLATFQKWFKAGEETRELARTAGAEVPDEALFRVVEDEAYQARQEAQRTEADKLKAEREQALKERDAARQETMRAHAIRQQAEAASFCDGLMAGAKLFPVEREPLIAALVQAAQDDATGPATFSGTGTEGKTRVDALKAIYEARPAHGLTPAQVAAAGTAGFSVLPGAGDTTQDPTQPTPDGKVVPAARLDFLREKAGIPAKKA